MTDRQAPGVIRADEAYTVSDFCKRMGIGDYVWRKLRREMTVVKLGQKRYVRGADWLAYLGRAAAEQPTIAI
jgi:hypothetical protein